MVSELWETAGKLTVRTTGSSHTTYWVHISGRGQSFKLSFTKGFTLAVTLIPYTKDIDEVWRAIMAHSGADIKSITK